MPVLKPSGSDDGQLQLSINQFTEPDGLTWDFKFRQLNWGFELSALEGESGFYGLYSGGQHGRYEVKLVHMQIDGGNRLMGKASISFNDDLSMWFNTLLNQYFDKCLNSRLRSSRVMREITTGKWVQEDQAQVLRDSMGSELGSVCSDNPGRYQCYMPKVDFPFDQAKSEHEAKLKVEARVKRQGREAEEFALASEKELVWDIDAFLDSGWDNEKMIRFGDYLSELGLFLQPVEGTVLYHENNNPGDGATNPVDGMWPQYLDVVEHEKNKKMVKCFQLESGFGFGKEDIVRSTKIKIVGG